MTIREFTRNIYKYVKTSGSYVLTINGKEAIKVVVTQLNKANVTTENKNIVPAKEKDVVTTKQKVETARFIPNVKTADEIWKEKEYRISHYACGCKKAEGKLLCSTHNRR